MKKKRRAHYFQHVPFEGLGSIEKWLLKKEYSVTCTRFFENPAMPDRDEMDLLIIMGGPMSVNDEDEFPWLAAEKRFIAECISADIPVLGICLGAQFIAAAMGGRVYPNREKEIGWFSVQTVPTSETAVFQFPAKTTAFHWHGETFDLPPGAVHIARSEGCEHQAFQLGRSVIGLQFHLETTQESAQALVENCRNELIPGCFVQAEEVILSVPRENYAVINELMGSILAFLHQSDGEV